MLSVLVRSAQAAPDAAALKAAWEADAEAMVRHGGVPDLAARDFAELTTGQPVVHRFDTDEGSFALGAIWVPVAAPWVWVAIQDPVDRPMSDTVTQEWLQGQTLGGPRRLYMRLDAPWPVADRQWVSDFRPEAALFDETDGRVWRVSWTLGDRATAPHPDPAATWIDENRGSWTLVSTDGGTLCVMTVRALIGGAIPASVSQSFARSGLHKTLRAMAALAASAPAHYDATHAPAVDPSGRPVPFGG